MQIPKVQKDSQVKQLFALLGPSHIKAACKNVDEIDPLEKKKTLQKGVNLKKAWDII